MGAAPPDARRVHIFDAPADLAATAAAIRAKPTRRLRPGEADPITYIHVGPAEVIAAFRGLYAAGRTEEGRRGALGEKLLAQ